MLKLFLCVVIFNYLTDGAIQIVRSSEDGDKPKTKGQLLFTSIVNLALGIWGLIVLVHL